MFVHSKFPCSKINGLVSLSFNGVRYNYCGISQTLDMRTSWCSYKMIPGMMIKPIMGITTLQYSAVHVIFHVCFFPLIHAPPVNFSAGGAQKGVVECNFFLSDIVKARRHGFPPKFSCFYFVLL